MTNYFLVMNDDDREHNGRGFDRLRRNIENEFCVSPSTFDPLCDFLDKKFLVWENIKVFLDGIEEYLTRYVHKDSNISILSYNDRFIFVPPPALPPKGKRYASEYYITGFNCFPEHVLEGTGLKHWG